jgi:hypothetical protein
VGGQSGFTLTKRAVLSDVCKVTIYVQIKIANMKKSLSLAAVLFWLLPFEYLSAQDVPSPIGYRLPFSQNGVPIYKNLNGRPDLNNARVLGHSLFFMTFNDQTYTDADTHIKYVEIRIPGKEGVNQAELRAEADPPDASSADFNQLFWMKESDFKTASAEYKMYAKTPVFGVLTIPLRIRPAINGHPSSIFNGDLNIGAFVGVMWALDHGGKFMGGPIVSFGVSSLSQNSSNNTGIKDTTSTSLTAATYSMGLVLDVNKKFQLGMIVGWDNAFGNLSQNYIYQNKAWFSLSLNYNFLKYNSVKNASNN